MPKDAEISLRPITPGDGEFLLAVYASTREDEMARVDWNEEKKAAFIRMQFDAQDRYYRQNYPGYDFSVILVDDLPAGRLYLHRRPAEIRIMDIALLPAFRRQGVGEKLLREVQAEGTLKGVPVTIHVEKFNPAFRLYERLGFGIAEDKGVYCFLSWTPRQPQDQIGS